MKTIIRIAVALACSALRSAWAQQPSPTHVARPRDSIEVASQGERPHGLWPAVRESCPTAFKSLSSAKSCGSALFNDKPLHLGVQFGFVPMSGIGIGPAGLIDRPA